MRDDACLFGRQVCLAMQSFLYESSCVLRLSIIADYEMLNAMSETRKRSRPKKLRTVFAVLVTLNGWFCQILYVVLRFENSLSEFNHQRNDEGKCVLVTGATPLPNDDTCRGDADYWYERTAYRKIPYSTCEDGERPDRGARHACPGLSGHGFWFWFFILILPFAFTFIIGYGYYRRSGMARGFVLYA